MQALCVLVLALGMASPLLSSRLHAQSADVSVYTGVLGPGFQDRSTAPHAFGVTAPATPTTAARGPVISWDTQPWLGLSFANEAATPVSAVGALRLWGEWRLDRRTGVHGGSA